MTGSVVAATAALAAWTAVAAVGARYGLRAAARALADREEAIYLAILERA
jgi:hypothetical protein